MRNAPKFDAGPTVDSSTSAHPEKTYSISSRTEMLTLLDNCGSLESLIAELKSIESIDYSDAATHEIIKISGETVADDIDFILQKLINISQSTDPTDTEVLMQDLPDRLFSHIPINGGIRERVMILAQEKKEDLMAQVGTKGGYDADTTGLINLKSSLSTWKFSQPEEIISENNPAVEASNESVTEKVDRVSEYLSKRKQTILNDANEKSPRFFEILKGIGERHKKLNWKTKLAITAGLAGAAVAGAAAGGVAGGALFTSALCGKAIYKVFRSAAAAHGVRSLLEERQKKIEAGSAKSTGFLAWLTKHKTATTIATLGATFFGGKIAGSLFHFASDHLPTHTPDHNDLSTNNIETQPVNTIPSETSAESDAISAPHEDIYSDEMMGPTAPPVELEPIVENPLPIDESQLVGTDAELLKQIEDLKPHTDVSPEAFHHTAEINDKLGAKGDNFEGLLHHNGVSLRAIEEFKIQHPHTIQAFAHEGDKAEWEYDKEHDRLISFKRVSAFSGKEVAATMHEVKESVLFHTEIPIDSKENLAQNIQGLLRAQGKELHIRPRLTPNVVTALKAKYEWISQAHEDGNLKLQVQHDKSIVISFEDKDGNEIHSTKAHTLKQLLKDYSSSKEVKTPIVPEQHGFSPSRIIKEALKHSHHKVSAISPDADLQSALPEQYPDLSKGDTLSLMPEDQIPLPKRFK